VTRWQRVFLAVFLTLVSLAIPVAVATNGDGDDLAGRCETWETCRP
jgi:hypothetical protein